MKKALSALLILFAIGTVPLSARAQLALAGSDSWEPVIRPAFLQSSSLSTGADLSLFLGYSGGGQTPGETALKNNQAGVAGANQVIAFFTQQLTDATINPTTQVCSANPNAQDIVIGLDGLINIGKTVNFTSGNPQLGTLGNANSLNIISILYTGYDFNNTAAGNDCNGSTRRALLNDYSSLFTAGGPGQTSPTTPIRHVYRRGDASATSKLFLVLLGLPTANQKYCNGTDFQDLDPVRRFAGPSDQVAEFDGTLGVVLSILVPTFSNTVPDLYTGGSGLASSPSFGLFGGGQAPTCSLAPTNLDPSSAAPGVPVSAYAGSPATFTNIARCDCRFPVPANFTNPASAEAKRFNWNVRLGIGCLAPLAATAPQWNVLNGDEGSAAGRRENTPPTWGTKVAGTVAGAAVPLLPTATQRCCNVTGAAGGFRRQDPRLLNLFVRDVNNGSLKPTVGAPVIAYYRLASTNKGLSTVTAAAHTARCTQVNASDFQLSCLVTNVPGDDSSIGYGALPVYKDVVSQGLPKPTSFKANTDPVGASDTYDTILDRSYVLSRYVFLSSLKGFNLLGESAAADNASSAPPYTYTGSPGSVPGTAQQQVDAQWNLAKAVYSNSRPISAGVRNTASAIETLGFLALPFEPYAVPCTEDANSPTTPTKISLNTPQYFQK